MAVKLDNDFAPNGIIGKKIDTSKMKDPSFKIILTATGDYAYCRTDGIYIVPIGCLKE